MGHMFSIYPLAVGDRNGSEMFSSFSTISKGLKMGHTI